MKYRILALILLLIGKISFSQLNPETKTLAWLDSTFSSRKINWEEITSEFVKFGQQNFKKTLAIPEIIKAINADSPVKKPQRDKVFKITDLALLESFAKQVDEIRPALKSYLSDVLKKADWWCTKNALTKYYLLIHETEIWSLSSIGMYSLTNRLISIDSYLNDDALYERLSLLLLIEKLFLNQEYKSRQQQAEEECSSVTIEYSEKTQPEDIEPDSLTLDETEPCFAAGEDGMIQYIQDNVYYPEMALMMGIQGTVYTSFVVNRDGSLSDIMILKSSDDLLSLEAIRLIQNMPHWLPGTQAGKAIRVRYQIPIRFSIA